jgi:hypothetical protein
MLTISSIVHAQWILVSTSLDQKETFFIEKSSITQVNKFKRAWQKIELESDSSISIKRNLRSARFYVEFDCIEKRRRELSYELFRQPNLTDVFDSSNKISDWSYIPPNSNDEKISNFVCFNK